MTHRLPPTDAQPINEQVTHNQYDKIPVNEKDAPMPMPTGMTYAKPKRIWLWLPWALLALVLAGVLWLMTQGKTPFFQNSNTTPTTTAAVGDWQPPKAEPVPAQTTTGNLDKTQPIASYHNAVATAAPSVVNIYTTQKVESHPYLDDPMLRRYYEFHGGLPQDDAESTSLGSGVIVSQDGFIITNAHVVNQADSVIVGLSDGRKVKAKIIGVDTESDLAVIKVDLTGLKPLGFREKPIEVGDVVLAIGNPFGVGQTVTQGIISATGRSGLGINTFEDFIQTDAAINPGNSGGALVDAYGQLVGINTAIFSRSGGSMGIGFAIPTTSVEQVMNAIIKTGKVSRGWLGIEVVGRNQDPTKLEADTTGVTVMNVIHDSPAAKAGLKSGDIILALDDKTINDANSLIQYVARKAPNTVLNAKVKRGSTETVIPITLSERKSLAALQKMEEQQQLQNDNGQLRPNQRQSQQYRQVPIPKELLDMLNR